MRRILFSVHLLLHIIGYTMECCSRKRLLMVMTSACACAAFGLLCIAVATDYWLYTLERKAETVNGTFYTKYWSGLWRKCKVDGKSCNIFFSILCDRFLCRVALLSRFWEIRGARSRCPNTTANGYCMTSQADRNKLSTAFTL